jgi:hypothetical protein
MASLCVKSHSVLFCHDGFSSNQCRAIMLGIYLQFKSLGKRSAALPQYIFSEQRYSLA